MPKSKKPEAEVVKHRGIPVYEIERYARLLPNKKKLTDRWGAGPWEHDKIVDLMLEHRATQAVEALSQVAKGHKSRADRERMLKGKTAAYLTAFPNVTPNDAILVEQLAEIEIQLEELADDAELAGQSEAGDTLSAKEKRGSLRLKLLAEHRRIQNDLGIARAQRQDDIDASATIAAASAEARALIVSRGVPIICPHCYGEHAINQGIIIYHFRGDRPWRWESTCPNPACQKQIVIEGAKHAKPHPAGTPGQQAAVSGPDGVLHDA